MKDEKKKRMDAYIIGFNKQGRESKHVAPQSVSGPGGVYAEISDGPGGGDTSRVRVRMWKDEDADGGVEIFHGDRRYCLRLEKDGTVSQTVKTMAEWRAEVDAMLEAEMAAEEAAESSA